MWIKKVLVATDGSETSMLAIQRTAELALNVKCSVTLVHVIDAVILRRSLFKDRTIDKFKEELSRAGKSILRLSQKPFADIGIAADTVMLEGHVAESICKLAADGNFDIVVVGERGLGTAKRILLGSVSQEVIRSAPCPVMIVKKGKHKRG